MKINLGAGPNWKHDGWHVLDYQVEKLYVSKIDLILCIL